MRCLVRDSSPGSDPPFETAHHLKRRSITVPDPSRHAEDRNALESLLRRVPGFRGYLEKEYRRESDYLARTWMADRLQKSKPALDDYMRGLVDAGQIDQLSPCERVRSRLDGLISEIRAAERGYSGVFDFVKVDEQQLDNIYELDMSLMNEVEALAASIEQLGVKTEPPSVLVPALLREIDEVRSKFQRRSEQLKGVGPQDRLRGF
jgi:hypothetical protein